MWFSRGWRDEVRLREDYDACGMADLGSKKANCDFAMRSELNAI